MYQKNTASNPKKQDDQQKSKPELRYDSESLKKLIIEDQKKKGNISDENEIEYIEFIPGVSGARVYLKKV